VLAQQRGLGGDAAVLAGLGELLDGVVRALDVGRVVLGVVQLHDLAGDVRLESAVVVVEIGKNVLGHSGVSFQVGGGLRTGVPVAPVTTSTSTIVIRPPVRRAARPPAAARADGLP